MCHLSLVRFMEQANQRIVMFASRRFLLLKCFLRETNEVYE